MTGIGKEKVGGALLLEQIKESEDVTSFSVK